MKTKGRILITVLIPLLSFLYAVGDYGQWWDKIRGRTSAAKGVKRLASPYNFPDILILKDQEEFENLLCVILARTENVEVKKLYKKNISPSAIVRIGGTLKPDVGDDLPEGWPNPKFAPDSSPVGFIYDNPASKNSLKGKNIKPIGNLRDIRNWINESRDRERFIVLTILLGILSIVVATLEVKGKNKNKEQNIT